MEVAGLAFGIVATADLCIKYGKTLIELYQSFKHANAELEERFIRVRMIWMRTNLQLEFIKQIEKSLSPEHQEIQSDVLGVLAHKMKGACMKLDGLLKKEGNDAKRWKYTLVKSSLDDTICEVQEWQELYDPSWFLIIRIADQSVDRVLQHTISPDSGKSHDAIMTGAVRMRDSIRPQPLKPMSVFLPASGLDYTRVQKIPFSRARFLPRLNSTKWVVVDSVPPDGFNLDLMTKAVRELAARLMNAEPAIFGILRCRGVVKGTAAVGGLNAFDVIFDPPKLDTQAPQSLRGQLVLGTTHTLTKRVGLAKQIARAVSYVHTLGFVHKNVRPENFITFDTEHSSLGSFYLIGFEHFRIADGRTFRHGDSDWFKNIYRHPDRQGMHPAEDYIMQHDIYSLGVCLLEIGIWDSFLAYNSSETPSDLAGILDLTTEDLQRQPPSAIKNHLVTLARTHLPSRVGKIYEGVVINCLTCLDESNVDFGVRGDLRMRTVYWLG